ncbi:decarboxylating NADP(+)-dependent phosphogluconate dehydrogenase [Faecalicatena sp. AGMB00832]|uniref:6-phosphogluconate dehydrogenase, decarboxylating n=1 Tax=Faecalicatena faecalis TaxID=2726362 RepID=A0ABS6D3T9_9FIRM|nr:decarboxylating NADP(+)-dependent phosphogluconate dehydrogenase [Faecalicatena faecalis]MBU3876243.1 decarboxylating NADP(+)-dependent phosphogluconate dehydrogenase [Faecalicatena faecalis]
MKNLLDIGLIGLSVMGRSLAQNMADHGFQTAVYNRSPEVTEQVMKEHPHKNITAFYNLAELVYSLKRPRRIFLMIQAGKPVDTVIDQLLPLLEEGDIIMDGGNSYFEDTNRRFTKLEDLGIRYLGVGVSGGEEGARRGPSIMPGGSRDAYDEVSPILEAIAAKAMEEPCCTYIGPMGAGHYVKMVHNGIEYADMQLIAEAYLLLKYAGGFTNEELADTFHEWNEGELQSYLIAITADIFREKDDLAPGDLIDHILDSAKQKGTGRWASIESLHQGVDISMITAACNARVMSNHLKQRQLAASRIYEPSHSYSFPDKKEFADMVKNALYAGKIIAYAQGFSLMKDASDQFDWNLDLGKIASIFRAGCIIQAIFLNDITKAYTRNPKLDNLILDEFFLDRINENQGNLREVVSTAVLGGLPVPAFANAVSYLDEFSSVASGANLIQAQRDCFGAHTYERTDREGTFHHEWRK